MAIAESETPHRIHPREKANILSRLFFCWQLRFLIKCYKKHITENNLYGTLKSHQSKSIGDKIEEAWNKEVEQNKNPSLWRVLRIVFGLECTLCGLLTLIKELVFKFSCPLIIGKLLNYYVPGQNTISKNEAYAYASLLALVSFCSIFVDNIHDFACNILAMKVRIACSSLIYRKSLKLDHSVLAKTSMGQMINLLANDISKFNFGALYFHYVWIAPLQSLIVLSVLYVQLGPSALTGSVILIIFILIQSYAAKKLTFYRMCTAVKTDQRIRLTNEIIAGIKVIKMYAWEKTFALLLEKARKVEMKYLRKQAHIRALQIALGCTLFKVEIYFNVLTYILSGQKLSPYYVYVLVALYELIRVSFGVCFSRGLNYVSGIVTSVKRVRTFLTHLELDPNMLTITSCKEIFLKNVFIQFDNSANENTLNNVSMTVKDNELVALIGPVGAGKSTILQVLLHEIKPTKGKVQRVTPVSYSSQEAWLFRGSIKDNILFGEAFNKEKYQEVIEICALETDLSLFPYGDGTLVGEKGANLSGGQKARINLARAVYRDASLYLLDDPLSAVDANVGKHIFEKCIKRYLGNKPRILVTHQLQYLQGVDKIYVIEDGQIIAAGTYEELVRSNKYLKLTGSKDNSEKKNLKTIIAEDNFKTLGEPKENEEIQRSGALSSKLFIRYFASSGNFLLILVTIFVAAVSLVVLNSSSYYLAIWTNIEENNQDNSSTFTSLYIYTAFIILPWPVILISHIQFFKLCLNASKNLHKTMVNNILHVPINYLNSNSSGRILNRFSTDLGLIDENITFSMSRLNIVVIVGTVAIVIICIVNPWMLLPTIVMFITFYYYKNFYLYTSSNLRRIEAKTRSLVYSHLSTTLRGLATVRSYNVQAFMETEFEKMQDLHSSAFYMFLACDAAFGFWLDFVSVLYITVVILSLLLIGTETHGANVGVSITESVAIIGMIQFGMKQMAELSNQMTCVERVLEYTELETEADSPKKPLPSWPEYGKIEFRGVSLRYAPDEPSVLKNVSFLLHPKEKIGIVGKTGAGKSSLLTAIFRLVPIEGDIFIDDISIQTVSLESVRSKISIIPQDPVLFSGTIRSNLDPLGKYQDDQLWDALEKVELKIVVAELDSGLASKVNEGGLNFSVGQRQLLCLARALVRMNKILILDEATANVDFQTDELIQRTINKNFQDCTILIIAHRIHAVMNCDRILVMDAGKVAEFDKPASLLENTEGIFYQLFQNSY